MKVSVVIPTYNEEKVIKGCLESLTHQDYPNLEIIVVDDGSNDQTYKEIIDVSSGIKDREIRVWKQDHIGPGAARNLGVIKSTGDILVFVDADMEFEKDFVSKLVESIIEGKIIGTFSKEEYLLNKNNAYARCWNLNLGRESDCMIPSNYPDESPVFRAILKSKFNEAGGFDTKIGYTDDWSLSRKLRVKASMAPGAVFYHRNPESIHEVWKQARWFGKNEFLTGNVIRQLGNIIRYNPLTGVIIGIIGSVKYHEPIFLSFKLTYDSAVFVSILRSIFSEPKYK